MTAPFPNPSMSRGWLKLWLPRVLAVCLALHFYRGVFPITAVEGDEQGVVNGLKAWARSTDDFEAAAYLYPIQSGSYHVIHALHSLSGLDQLSIFGTLSFIGAVGFIVLASHLLARAGGLRPAWVAVALLMTQELTTGAFYANTNAIAGVVAMAGLVTAQSARRRPALWLAGGLIGLGGWLRMDSLLLSPVVLALRLSQFAPRRAIIDTAEVALSSVLAVVATLSATGLSVLDVWESFSQRESFTSWQMFSVKGWLVLGFGASITTLSGLLWLVHGRRWSLLGLVVMGSFLSIAVYGGSFTTPKYLYYAAPFLLLSALAWIGNWWTAPTSSSVWRRGVAAALVTMCIFEAFVGVQSSDDNFRRFDPESFSFALQHKIGRKDIRVGWGEGEILSTDDGPRMRGAHFWAPTFWRREKRFAVVEQRRIVQALSSGAYEVVITSTYLSMRLAEGWLRDHRYSQGTPLTFPGNASSNLTPWRQPQGKTLTLILVNHTDREMREFAASTTLGRHLLFINDRGGIDSRRFTNHAGIWKRLSARENGIVALYAGQSQDGTNLESSASNDNRASLDERLP
jgi:hypothetical protein